MTTPSVVLTTPFTANQLLTARPKVNRNSMGPSQGLPESKTDCRASVETEVQALQTATSVESLTVSMNNVQNELRAYGSELTNLVAIIKKLKPCHCCSNGIDNPNLEKASTFSSSLQLPAPTAIPKSANVAHPGPLSTSANCHPSQGSPVRSPLGFTGTGLPPRHPSVTGSGIQPSGTLQRGQPAFPFNTTYGQPARSASGQLRPPVGPPPPIPCFKKNNLPQSAIDQAPSDTAPWTNRGPELRGPESKKAQEEEGIRRYRELVAKQVDPNFDPLELAVESSRRQPYGKPFDFSRYPQAPKKEVKKGLFYHVIGWMFD